MADTPEGKVKKAIDRLLAKYKDVHVTTPTTGGYGRSGDFDRRITYKGVPIGVEAKPDADTMPTRLQTDNAVRFNKAGGAALCIHKDNLYELEAYMNTVENLGLRAHRPFIWPLRAIDDYNQSKDNHEI
jgi:hypothetical protein